MRVSGQGSGLKRLFVYCLVFAIAMPIAQFGNASEQRIDLDGNPLNGAESTVETNVLQSFPVEIENVVHNNAVGRGFSFEIPGAGPGGFQSFVTSGPAAPAESCSWPSGTGLSVMGGPSPVFV